MATATTYPTAPLPSAAVAALNVLHLHFSPAVSGGRLFHEAKCAVWASIPAAEGSVLSEAELESAAGRARDVFLAVAGQLADREGFRRSYPAGLVGECWSAVKA
ncbi:hypothetical protein [Streptomyces sp. MZ04]|uniref:hypothetical protein n=1 Tax=Streptomyces sp. MZ04 TaxID=2559236 RepID=UPI00107EC417|nr:hypothetical protein [Streptomyces sp. MZ04]TGB06538.1 hypothetical protein E2651_23275 [Streptomyces sp. MZ04]